MVGKEDRPSAVWVLVAVVLLLLFAYTASYYATVRRTQGSSFSTSGLTSINSFYDADYMIGGRHSQRIFWPIHRLDRILRKAYWEQATTIEDVQYFSPGPEFKLTREAAAMKAFAAEASEEHPSDLPSP